MYTGCRQIFGFGFCECAFVVRLLLLHEIDHAHVVMVYSLPRQLTTCLSGALFLVSATRIRFPEIKSMIRGTTITSSPRPLYRIYTCPSAAAMPCAKCAAKSKGTTLATPGVKKKNELYHGSVASSSNKSATLGNTGIGKSKSKNPYAAYSASCEKCKTKIEQGKALCNACAYKSNGMMIKRTSPGAIINAIVACSMCGKSMNQSSFAGSKAPVITGQRFSAK